jgi:hypothetical protein
MVMKRFFYMLSAPEEWSPASVFAVGLAFVWALAVLAGAAFDAQF